jgi:hypothetical protein
MRRVVSGANSRPLWNWKKSIVNGVVDAAPKISVYLRSVVRAGPVTLIRMREGSRLPH